MQKLRSLLYHYHHSIITKWTKTSVLIPSIPLLVPQMISISHQTPSANLLKLHHLRKEDNLTLGLDLNHHSDTSHIFLRSWFTSTIAARIPLLISTIRDSYIIAVDDSPITTIDDITKARSSSSKSYIFTMVPPEHVNSTPDSNIPQIHFNNITIIAHQHHAAEHDTPSCSDPHSPPLVSESIIFSAIFCGRIKPRLTRAFLRRLSDWMD